MLSDGFAPQGFQVTSCWRGVRLQLGLVVALVVCAAGLPGVAFAATYETAGCPPTAPLWKIQFKFHPVDEAGRTMPSPDNTAALEEVSQFAQLVGQLSECAVRVRVDVVEDAGVWRDQRAVTPGYDSTFYRHPSNGEEAYAGETDNETVVFPVPADRNNAPNSRLIMHEWLHLVVGFYSPSQGWPREDVHGACLHPAYKDNGPCMINAQWFSDLMLGRIVENGQSKGLLRDEWAYQGTKVNPLHRPVEWRLEQQDRRDGNRVRVRVISNRTGPATLTVTRNGGPVVHQQALTMTADSATVTLPQLPVGRYQMCASAPETDQWQASKECFALNVTRLERSSASLLKTKRLKGGRVQLRATGPLVGRTVTLASERFSCTLGTGCRRTFRSSRRMKLTSKARVVRLPKRQAGPGYASLTVYTPGFDTASVRYFRSLKAFSR